MRETYYQKEYFVTHMYSNRITYSNREGIDISLKKLKTRNSGFLAVKQ